MRRPVRLRPRLARIPVTEGYVRNMRKVIPFRAMNRKATIPNCAACASSVPVRGAPGLVACLAHLDYRLGERGGNCEHAAEKCEAAAREAEDRAEADA
jgi:hypothetical protein